MRIFQDDPTFDDFLAEVNTYRNAITFGRLRQRYRRKPFMTLIDRVNCCRTIG